MTIKRLAASLLPGLLGRVPKTSKLLYPFYLAGRLNIALEEREIPALPPSFDGLRLTYASDIHFGPLFHEDEARRLEEALKGWPCDLIILGGDYGDQLENAVRFFELLEPFPSHPPVLAVIGNHDYGKPGQPLTPLFEAMAHKQVTPLVNRCWYLKRGGALLAVCAPDDILAGKPDIKSLKAQAAPADFVLFTPHSPDVLPLAKKEDLRFHLALCGHTHGGQIAPFGHSLHSSSRFGDLYRSGWKQEQGADILISEGVGTSILPMRLGTQSQIHRLILRAKLQG